MENLRKSEDAWKRLRAKARERAFQNRTAALQARGNRQSELRQLEILMRDNRAAGL